MRSLSQKVVLEHGALSDQVNEVYDRILPLGLFSHVIRLIIVLFTGKYFKSHEHRLRVQLESAVDDFLDSFS